MYICLIFGNFVFRSSVLLLMKKHLKTSPSGKEQTGTVVAVILHFDKLTKFTTLVR